MEMFMTTDGIQVKSSQIFKEDKFISGRLTRKLINENSSSSAPDCYHAGARVTVPFMWESEPGTPKHRLVRTSASLPPLTPPPSHFFSSPATRPIRKHSSRVHSNNSVFPKFSFMRSRNDVRLSSSSENSIQSLSSPSSLSSASPSVLAFQMTPLCDYYYSRRYGFAFEAEEEEYLRSSSFSLSPFVCFRSKKYNRKNNARRSEGRYLSILRRYLPPLCFSLIGGAA